MQNEQMYCATTVDDLLQEIHRQLDAMDEGQFFPQHLKAVRYQNSVYLIEFGKEDDCGCCYMLNLYVNGHCRSVFYTRTDHEDILEVIERIVASSSKSRMDFLTHCQSVNIPVLCATMYLDDFWQYIRKGVQPARLCVGHTQADLQAFLTVVDIDYPDNDIQGIIWFYDGSWSERTSVMDQMQWVHHAYPQIPDYLLHESWLIRKQRY